jgi:Zn-dependent protease with chaperone function
LASLNAKLDLDRPESKPNIELSTLKKLIKTIDDFLGTERLGYQALSEKNESFVRTIMHKLDMDDYCIEIRKMSNYAQRLVGRTNAFVIPSVFGKKSHSYLYISEDWFDGLSDESKESLVKHELMHLKQNHVARQGRFALLSGLGLYMINVFIQNVIKYRNYPYITEDTPSHLLIDACPKILLMTWLLLVLKNSRSLEKEADIEAAKTMTNKEGFVDLFNDIKENTEDPKSKFKIKRFISSVFKPIEKLFYSHPELDERIDYIKAL